MSFLSSKIQNQLKKEAGVAEKKGRLTEKQLEIIYSQKLFNLFVPKSLGGLELDLIQGLQIEEELARIDGSLGWTVTLCSGANAFVGYLSQELAAKIFENPKVCFGGSGKIGGIAEETKDGYVINGKWNYVTGAPHVTIFTANCQIKKGDKLLINKDGAPVYKSFLFLPEEINLIKDWRTMGLVSTASHSYEVKNLKVNFDRSFVIDSTSRTIENPVYQYPFLSFAYLTLAVNHLGMQEHFLDLSKVLFESIQEAEHKDFRTQLLKKAQRKIENRRILFYTYAETSWKELRDKGKVSQDLEKKISEISREVVKKGRELALEIYPYLGITAANPDMDLNRLVRDILTASQHSLLL